MNETCCKPDIFGRETFIGDEVAINPPVYKGLVIAKVTGFTPKGFKVLYLRTGKQSSCNTVVSQVAKKVN